MPEDPAQQGAGMVRQSNFNYATATTGLTKAKSNANSSSVLRTSDLKFGGYVSDWAQYERGFALSDIAPTAYTDLVYSFFGICGDQGSKADKVKASCNALGKAEGSIMSLDFWGSYQNAGRYNPGYPWNPIYDNINADNWDQLDAGNVRGLVGELVHLKQQNPDIDVSLSIGGWTLSEPFHRVAADATLTANFAASVVEMVKKFQVSGEPLFTTIDIDWEFPGHGGECHSTGCYTKNDGDNFVTLLQAVRTALDDAGYSQVKLSSAVGATQEYIELVGAKNYQALGGKNGLLDKINLMSYDFWGAWENGFGHQTNLFGDSVDPKTAAVSNSADRAIKMLASYGVEKSRIMLGIANYSRGKQGIITEEGNPFSVTKVTDTTVFGTYEGTVVEGYDLFANMAGKDLRGDNGFSLYTDVANNADYYYNNTTGLYYSIDTPRTAALKANYAKANGLRGVFVWVVEQDYQGIIADTVNHTLGNTVKGDGSFTTAELDAFTATCGSNVTVKQCAELNAMH
ncbi:MAG: glycosyl hydrolase family 18 protein [Shewanella sp.]|nr:glycosyl hydrolase family 18 protein [Shewanella sp.]